MSQSELIRRLFRRLLPVSAYSLIASCVDRYSTFAKLGLRRYNQIYGAGESQIVTREIELFRGGSPFFFRPGTPDVVAIVQNIVREEWGQVSLSGVRTVLDAGAYIGDTTVYFLHKYPECTVVAVEPSCDSIELLGLNTAPFEKRARVLRRGLWHESTELPLSGNFIVSKLGLSHDSNSQVVSTATINVQQILDLYGFESFDVVKLDIEGAEESVITKNSSWLEKVKLLMIEFHGKSIEKACLQHLSQYSFKHKKHRSVDYFFR